MAYARDDRRWEEGDRVSEPTVVLILRGEGRVDRLKAWVEALGRAKARSRGVRVERAIDAPQLSDWCEAAGVSVLPGVDLGATPDILVIAGADHLPTPGALKRLVAATDAHSRPYRTRVLPYGGTAAGPGGEPVRSPAPCVALPIRRDGLDPDDSADSWIEALEARGTEAPELSFAAVFVDATPERSIVGSPLRRTADRPATGHPATLPATAVHRLLTYAGLPQPQAPLARDNRPFLSIVTRTQGTRLLMLEEMLTCLCAQSVRDFELLLACHRVSESDSRLVRELVGGLPRWMRERTKVIDVERPGRAAPLNDALALATGRYFAVLDDDDAVTSDWVATFADMESGHEGTVLRASALRQDVEPVGARAGGGVTPKEIGPAYPGWPREFNLIEHLWDNASPFMTLAFPRGLFDDLAWRFDESMETAEDWAYLLRSAALVGVVGSSSLTAVYRTWTRQEGSREIHELKTWDASRRAAVNAVNDAPLVLAPGAVKDIRALHEALLAERADKFRFAALNEQAAADLRTVNEAVVVLRERVAQLEERLARVRRRRQSG